MLKLSMAKTTVIDHKKNFKSVFATEDNKFIYHTKQDVNPTLEYVKQLSEQAPGKDLRHIAEVPMIVYQRAVREGWAQDSAKWKDWLNHSDNKPFRTWKGKV